VGAFNPNDSGVSVTFKVFDEGTLLGTAGPFNLGGHSGTQRNNIFGEILQGAHATRNAVVVVESEPAAELFTYAAVIDNATTDPILVLGARDVPAGATTKSVSVGTGGDRFVDQESSSSTTTIRVGDTVRWDWVASFHSTTSGSCAGGCVKDGKWDSGEHSPPFTFSRTFNEAGSFPYWCTVHGVMMTGTVVVNP
jgi:plastocyanin